MRPGVPGPAGDTLLEVRDLHVSFHGPPAVHAVRGMSFDIGRGEALGIVGESGSGKSAAVLAIMGLLSPDTASAWHGSATFDGVDLLRLREPELRRVRGARLAMIFQDPLSSLNPAMTIGSQIVEALEVHEQERGPTAWARAVELLKTVGIPDPVGRARVYPFQLSGGMRQRAMIAMALACRPELLIADEPTTALDVTIQAQIMDLLAHLRNDLGMALLLISHDLGLVAGAVDRLAVAYAGGIVEEGPVQSVFAEPRHPYTKGLLASLPSLEGERREALVPIPGSPPDMTAVPAGCAFAPRCARGDELCRTAAPTLRYLESAGAARQRVACHFPVDAVNA